MPGIDNYEPSLVFFFLPLPEPIPIPHGTTITFDLDEHDPRLKGCTRQPAPDITPIPGSDGGQLFVSIKFWQVKAKSDYHLRQAEAVQKVLLAVRGGELQPPPSPWPATITVVELATVASPPNTGSASDPFLRCLACLTDVVDAYRIAENVKMARISYEQLGPAIMTYHRSWAEPYEWRGPTVMLLDHVNVKVLDPEQLDPDRLQRVRQLLQQLRAQHPFSRWLELCRDRDYAFHIQGDYRTTVIQTALAVEVLVFAILAGLLWEQTFPALPTDKEIESAKTILERDPSPLRAELGKRLGGDWGSQASPSSVWQMKGASLRNRAVHLGYRPTRHEAEQAIMAAAGLDQFIRNRLAQTVTRHHRTAAMLLGEPGLERLGAMTKRVRNLLDQSPSEPDWLQSYREWRWRVVG